MQLTEEQIDKLKAEFERLGGRARWDKLYWLSDRISERLQKSFYVKTNDVAGVVNGKTIYFYDTHPKFSYYISLDRKLIAEGQIFFKLHFAITKGIGINGKYIQDLLSK